MTTEYEHNGKWYIRPQINGKRYHRLCKGCTTRKSAQIYEAEFIVKIEKQQNGIIPLDYNTKLASLIELYDNYSRINKLSHGRDAFCKYIGEYFGKNTYIKDIKAKQIDKFKEWLKAERKSSNSTVNKYLSALSKMYNLAIANGLFDKNPVKDVKKFREDNHKIRYLTNEEENKLYMAINEYCPYLNPIATCALQTGMRKGEILNLRWSNIDLDYEFIEITKTKSGKSRKIPISAKLMGVINNIPKTSEYVFINPKTKLPYTDIKKGFKKVVQKANILNFRFHDLRHTVATRLVAMGVSLPVVQEILGHAKISTTMRYAHVIPSHKKEAIEILNLYKEKMLTLERENKK